MFYLNSLNEQFDKSSAQLQLHQPKDIPKKASEKTRNIKGKLLFMSKFNVKYTDIYAYRDPSIADSSSKTRTLRQVQNTWREKYNVNFSLNQKKFPEFIIPDKVRESKKIVENLVDPNKFNIALPRWNSTSKLTDEQPMTVRQSVFNITNGLTTWESNDPKEPRIEQGVDSRNTSAQWNSSTLLIEKEKDQLLNQTFQDANNNTQLYWQKNSSERKAHSQLPISSERKSYEKARYYQDYKNPTKRIRTNAKIMKKVKDGLKFEREMITKEVIKEHPGCKHIKEKINALVEKRMQGKYLKQFNIAIGKINETLYLKDQHKWKDSDLIEKIKTITNWKDIEWLNPSLTDRSSREREELIRKDLLKPLVIYRKEISKEQDNIKVSRINEDKKSLKKEKIKRRNVSADKSSILSVSKYPIDSDFYLKIFNDQSHNLPEISKVDQKDKDFFDAYKTISINQKKVNERRNRQLRRNYSCWSYHSYHPGKYRAFEYDKSKTKGHQEGYYNRDREIEKQLENEPIALWSCCLNDDPNSKGCRKEKVCCYKWNYDNA